MGLIADILLVAAAAGACFYCVVLSRRLSRFTDLERGVGGAIATLSAQVDDMTHTLKSAQGAASASVNSLGDLTGRAEHAARRLELLVAAMHDLPDPSTAPPAAPSGKTPESPAAPPVEEQPVAASATTAESVSSSPMPTTEAEPAPALFSSRRVRGGGAAA